MASARRTRLITARRITGVFSGVATTALCLSVACSAFGGVVRTPQSVMRAGSSPASHGFTQPGRTPRPHDHGGPVFSAKLDAPAISRFSEKRSAAQAASDVAPRVRALAALTSADALQWQPGGAILKSDSKCSRTRGQPDVA